MFYMLAVWLLCCWGLASAVLHRGLFHVVAPRLINIWTSQSSLKHQKQVHVDGAWSSPASQKTSDCFIERKKAYNICLIPSAGACVSFEVSPLLLTRSSNWVNNITLMRISEYVYTKNQKLTFHVSKILRSLGAWQGRSSSPHLPHPLRLRSERIQHLPATTLNWIFAEVEYSSGSILDKNSKIILPIHVS